LRVVLFKLQEEARTIKGFKKAMAGAGSEIRKHLRSKENRRKERIIETSGTP
jgi:Sec-independent protein translocase protein TatA